MGQDLRDYSVVGMPFQDFLDAFLPQMTLSAQPHASCQAQAGRGIGEPTMRGKKRARTEDTMSSQPISYGQYIKLDDDGLLRVSTDAPAFQGIKVLPDIFQNINGGEQQLECSDASANEVLISIQEAHIVSDRIFSLVVFLNDDYSRLIRADRDGLIVTRKVKWAASDNSLNLKSLDDLTRRFEGVTKAQQGIDPTVRPLLAEEAEYRERAIQALKKHTRRAMTKPGKELAVYKIGVPCAEVEDDLRWFYTCGPESNPDGLRKRATRGYVAWDPIMDSVVFIKDSWRSVAGDLLPEAKVIGQLNAENVEFAPKLICGGDFPDHKTVTHEYVGARWNKGRRRTHEPRVHHRFAVNLGQPLWKFRSSKHFMHILYDAFTCLRQAVERCRILHRDISAWNILWDEASGRGILSDWDLSARMPPAGTSDVGPTVNMMAQLPTDSGRPPDRTGTWAFMSSLSLGKQGKLHDVQDDLESIFWVDLYIIFLYFPFDRKDAIHIIDTVINQYSFHPNGVPFGGHGKKIFIEEATLKPGDEYSIILPDTVSPPLLEWIGVYLKMLLGWHTYYKALARWTGGRSQGEDAEGDDNDDDDNDNDEDDDDDQKPRAPALRDYRVLDKKWRSILDKGERKGTFKDRDRLFDELHNGSPDQVLAQYRVLVKNDLKIETKINATESTQAHGASQQELHVSQPVLADSDSEQDDRDTLPVVGPAMADAADDMEEEEATRAAKRRRTVANGFQRTSSPTVGQSGRISPGKGRSLTPE